MIDFLPASINVHIGDRLSPYPYQSIGQELDRTGLEQWFEIRFVPLETFETTFENYIYDFVVDILANVIDPSGFALEKMTQVAIDALLNPFSVDQGVPSCLGVAVRVAKIRTTIFKSKEQPKAYQAIIDAPFRIRT